MKRNNRIVWLGIGVLACLIIFPMTALAVTGINYQGYLTDAGGAPLNGDVAMTFRIYGAAEGGTELWSESYASVTVREGVFNVVLGSSVPITVGAGILEGDRYLGVTVGTDAEMVPRMRLEAVPFAMRAAVAESVVSGVVDTGALSDTAVTEPKIASGAVTGAKVAAGTLTAANLQDGTAITEIADDDGAGSGLDSDRLDGYDSSDFAMASAVNSLISRIDALEAQVANLVALLQGVTRSTNNIYITGANLHIRSGSGSTNGTVNGLGNLIVGYNEESGDTHTGSHNVIVGRYHSYSSYAGMAVGYDHTISAPYATVTGGMGNTASGQGASVSGGNANVASGVAAAVSGGNFNRATGISSSAAGGMYNWASGPWSFIGGGGANNEANGNHAYASYSAILGGQSNVAGDPDSSDRTIGTNSTVSGGWGNNPSGSHSSITGGYGNTATGNYSSVNGGRINVASGEGASISGGLLNVASGGDASVAGGNRNTASGGASFVGGGGGPEYGMGNEAYANYSAILGGQSNVTGEKDSGYRTQGIQSTVSGGSNNIASGPNSSVVGGQYNKATGSYASVVGGGGSVENDGNEAFAIYSAILGGYRNLAGDQTRTDHLIAQNSCVSGGNGNKASGSYASVSGGAANTASAWGSSVSGGQSNTASGWSDSVSGGANNLASGGYSSVSGGRYNKATGSASSVVGGGGPNEYNGNHAFGNYTAILGGDANIAGDPALSYHSVGEWATVSGGFDNTASGAGASVSGGNGNTASGHTSSVSGGGYNTASYVRASVSGGNGNTASGQDSSVSGGLNRSAVGLYYWAAGGLLESF